MTQWFKRTRLVIDPPVQFRLLGRLAAYLLIYTVTLLHIGFAVEVLRKVVLTEDGPLVGVLYLEYLERNSSLLIAMFLIVPVLLYDLLRFSHRIVGPLYRIRRMMGEMAAGKRVDAFVPRKFDLMVELFEAFNLLIQACNARVEPQPTDTASVPTAPPTSVETQRVSV